MKQQRNVKITYDHYEKLRTRSYKERRKQSDLAHEALCAYFGEFKSMDSAPKDGSAILMRCAIGILYLAAWKKRHEVWACCRFGMDAAGPIVTEMSEDHLRDGDAGWLPLPGDNISYE